MTTFNGEKFLRAQLDSLIGQVILPLEILIGDDGSIDGTLGILEEFAITSIVPVRIFRNEPRLGFSRNFLTTAKHARGDFIAFCDQDDVWFPRKIFCIELALERSTVWLCSHRSRLINADGVVIGERNLGIVSSRTLVAGTKKYWPIYSGYSIGVRRDLVNSIISYLSRNDGDLRASVWNHDGWVSSIAAFMAEIAEIDEKLMDYRKHDSNVSGAKPERVVASTSTELKNNERYLEVTRELIGYFEWLSVQDVSSQIRVRAKYGVSVYARILDCLGARHARQSADNIFLGWYLTFIDVFRGYYANPYDGSFKFRWFVHDLIFMPRRFLMKK